MCEQTDALRYAVIRPNDQMIHLRTAMLWANIQRAVVMGTKGCPETSVRNHHCTLRNSPEELSSHLLGGGSLNSRKDKFFLIDLLQGKYVQQGRGQITEMFP
jgi:hypothetical protein